MRTILSCLLILAGTTLLPGSLPAQTTAPEKMTDAQLIAAFRDEADGDKDMESYNPIHLAILMEGKTPALVQGLVDIFKDGSVIQKMQAARLLGELNAPETAPALADYLSDKSEYYTFDPVMWALVRVDPKAAVQPLLDIYNSDIQRLVGDTAAGYRVDGPGESPDSFKGWAVKNSAMEWLGVLHQTQMADEFYGIMTGGDRSRAGYAAMALAKMGDVRAEKWARGILQKPGPMDSFTWGDAIDAIAEIADSGDKDLIDSLVKEPKIWGTYSAHLEAARWSINMAHMSEEQRVQMVAYLIHKKSDFMIPWAIHWLGKDGSDPAIQELKWTLQQPDLEKYQIPALIELRRNNIPVQGLKNGQGKYVFAF